MKAPRKLYVLVSRKLSGSIDTHTDVFLTHGAAKAFAEQRNKLMPDADWRVETYVKGD